KRRRREFVGHDRRRSRPRRQSLDTDKQRGLRLLYVADCSVELGLVRHIKVGIAAAVPLGLVLFVSRLFGGIREARRQKVSHLRVEILKFNQGEGARSPVVCKVDGRLFFGIERLGRKKLALRARIICLKRLISGETCQGGGSPPDVLLDVG